MRAFYVRRARRILPALLAMLAATLAAAWLLLLPEQYVAAAWAALAAMASVSNVTFWHTSGYFVERSLQPFLHTWSLGIEEQFYLIFPAVMVWGRRLPVFGLTTVIAVLTLLSFVLAVWAAPRSPSAAFFLLPTRAWELGAGALLAVAGRHLPSGAARHAGSFLGAISLVSGLAFLSEDAGVPGLPAVLPVLGTVLLIASGPQGVINRFLALRPFVLLGLMSYSLYLWHWPVIVLARHRWATEVFSAAQGVAIVALSLVLAFLSWRFIETPFRQPRRVPGSRAAKWAAAGSLAIAAVATVVVQLDGAPGRFNPAVLRMAASSRGLSELGKSCVNRASRFGECEFGARDVPVSFVLWGDSHAAAILPAVDSVAQMEGRRGYFVGRNACPPALGVALEQVAAPLRQACLTDNAETLEALAAATDIDTVILNAYWPNYLAPENALVTSEGVSRSSFATMRGGLEAVVARLATADKRVVVLFGLPAPGFNLPWQRATALAFGQEERPIPPPLSQVTDLMSGLDAALIDLAPGLCDSVGCRDEVDGWGTFVDANHISEVAAQQLVLPVLSDRVFERAHQPR